MKSRENLTTAFIMRMHYKKNDPRFEWRLAFFASMVLPKLLAQTDQNFDICMRVNEHHADRVRALSDKIKIFNVAPRVKNKIKNGYRSKARKYFIDFVDFKHVVGLDKYDIQIGLDTDDMPLRGDFVERIKDEVVTRGGKSIHISFQPHVFHVPTLRMFEAPVKYGARKGSAIFALYQSDEVRKYVFAYEDSHLKMPRFAVTRIAIEEDFCAYSVHDNNASTSLLPNSKQICI